MTISSVSQAAILSSTEAQPASRVTQAAMLYCYGPPAARIGGVSQTIVLAAYTNGADNVTTEVTQSAVLMAYGENPPSTSRQDAWTFILDGHRFYVLPLGQEGDWAYDTTTQEWCQLQSAGFNGLNFTHGVMWDLRIIGGDSQYSYLYELDPTQPLDEGWREITRVVTGGVATRSRAAIGVGAFSLTASVGDDASVNMPISLAFSDDNGVTWSQEFPITLTDASTQLLIWNALGSFSQPGRIFRITDTAGPVRFDGADAILNISQGADSSQEQDTGPQH